MGERTRPAGAGTQGVRLVPPFTLPVSCALRQRSHSRTAADGTRRKVRLACPHALRRAISAFSGQSDTLSNSMRSNKTVRSCEGAMLMESRVRRHDQESATQNRHGGCVLERAQPKSVHQVSPCLQASFTSILGLC